MFQTITTTQHIHLRTSLVQTDPLLHAREARQITDGCRCTVLHVGRLRYLGYPYISFRIRKLKSGRQDANDRVHFGVKPDCAADQLFLRAKAPSPQRIAHHRHLGPAAHILGVCKAAPHLRLDAQKAEEVRGNAGTL